MAGNEQDRPFQRLLQFSIGFGFSPFKLEPKARFK
jgi:hypothetical protein